MDTRNQTARIRRVRRRRAWENIPILRVGVAMHKRPLAAPLQIACRLVGFGALSNKRGAPRGIGAGQSNPAATRDFRRQKKRADREPWPINCEGINLQRGTAETTELGGKPPCCISCDRYAPFLTSWKTFFVQCSYAIADHPAESSP